jgi:hypothetical protein
MLAADDLSLAEWVDEMVQWLFKFRLRSFQLEDVCALLQGGIYSFLYPTDHGKSTILQISVVLGMIREPMRPNIVIKVTDDKARETVAVIARRLHIAAERYPEVEPNVRNFDRVGDGFYVAGADRLNDNPSVYASGIASSDLQGRRGRTHIDDVESPKQARSPAYQQILEDQVSAVMRTLEPRPDALWAQFGTPYYEHSVMFVIPKRLELMGPRFRLIRRPIVDKEGRSLWEDRRQKAEIHRAAMPSELEWQVAYMLEPPRYGRLEDAEINRLLDVAYPFTRTADIFARWYMRDDRHSIAQRKDGLARATWYIGWDPSASGEFGIVADVMVNEQCYLLDAFRQPGDIFTQISIIVDLHLRYPAAIIVIENNGQQKVIIDTLRERLPNAQIVAHHSSMNIKSPDFGIPPLLQRAVHGFLHCPAQDGAGRNKSSLITRECYGYPAKHAHLLPALWFTTYYHQKHQVIQPVANKSEQQLPSQVIPIDMSRVKSAWARGWQGMN